eukprot:Skav200669  [mRNA]  locus=scaffold1967:48166:48438:- [translate_table: standard]
MVDIDFVHADENLDLCLLKRWPILDDVLTKLVHDVQVHSVFQGAGVLSPPQPNWNLLSLDEEAREQKLRNEHCWSCLTCYFWIGCNATDQ